MAAKARKHEHSAPSDSMRHPVEQENREILVVDDDPGSRRALANVLGDRGYHVTAVGSAAEAMVRLRREPPPHLIVLDLYMPGEDGWDFRHEQKRDPRFADIPVIAVSAVGKLVDVATSMRKPLDYDAFLDAVRRHLAPKADRPPPPSLPR